MKTCTWCGKEYPDTAERCVIDHEPLQGGEPPPPPPGPDAAAAEPMPEPRWIHLDKIEGAFVVSEGYSRPDWAVIDKEIQRVVPPESISEAWTEAAVQWILKLRAELGGGYRVQQSKEFILLSTLEAAAASRVLRFAGATLARINELLKDAASKPDAGKGVILIFAEQDDYYDYVAYYYPDGTTSLSAGCLIAQYYVHIALTYVNESRVCDSLVHELTHRALCHLPLPIWLNEGLAKLIERTVEPRPQPFLDGELRDRHLTFWNKENIQQFWAGVSYYVPGDSSELSYSLGEILVRLLLQQSPEFLEFVKQANRDDAGQTAAFDCLGADLGAVAATFLGEGTWRPSRRAITECWDSYEREHDKAAQNAEVQDSNRAGSTATKH